MFDESNGLVQDPVGTWDAGPGRAQIGQFWDAFIAPPKSVNFTRIIQPDFVTMPSGFWDGIEDEQFDIGDVWEKSDVTVGRYVEITSLMPWFGAVIKVYPTCLYSVSVRKTSRTVERKWSSSSKGKKTSKKRVNALTVSINRLRTHWQV